MKERCGTRHGGVGCSASSWVRWDARGIVASSGRRERRGVFRKVRGVSVRDSAVSHSTWNTRDSLELGRNGVFLTRQSSSEWRRVRSPRAVASRLALWFCTAFPFEASE